MPEEEKQITYEGSRVPVVVVEIQDAKEPVNCYRLADGTTLKLKTTLVEVVRIIGRYSSDGDPIYLVRSTNGVVIDAPDELKRKDGGQ